MFISSLSFAQKDSSEIFTIAEQMPEYPGGMQKMVSFLSENVSYPRNMKENDIGGRVYLKFIIDTSGSISGINIVKSSGFSEFDEEAIRVVKKMPKWVPGQQNGKKVNAYFNLPINYMLANPYLLCNSYNKDEDYKESIIKIRQGDYKSALDYLEKVLIKNPNDCDALYNMGVIYYLNKQKKKGCKYLNKALEAKHSTAEQIINKYCN